MVPQTEVSTKSVSRPSNTGLGANHPLAFGSGQNCLV
jgi:hypothetical protein